MPDTRLTFHRHHDAASFTSAVADRLTTALEHGLRQRQTASFAVPGGTTPGPIFDDLARRALAWSQIAVTLTDERWVPLSDAGSNEALVRQRLLTGKAATAQVVGLYDGAATPTAGLAAIERRLESLPLPFDAVMLGMGGDGHFASLFPNMPALSAGLDLTTTARCVVSDQPINGQPRISLTLQQLLQTRLLLIAFRGADKLQIIEQAKTAQPAALPIAAVLHQDRVPVEIHYTD